MNRAEQIRTYCLEKPGAFEDHPWGETVFKAGSKGKIFCICGSEGAAITVKSTLEKQAALILLPCVEVARYVGRYGWVAVTLRDKEAFELALELIDESFDLVTGIAAGTRRKSRA